MGDTPPDWRYLGWRDLEQHRDQESAARHSLEERMMARYERLESRVNATESTLDMQRGAKALTYFLIGSNLLAAIAVIASLLSKA